MDTVARAIELARQGHCYTLDEIRRRLKAEGYANVSEHTAGNVIKRQLCALMRAAPEKASSGS